MSVATCNACNVSFADEVAQKAHYRCDWHRYNLKRKVASLPGVTEAWFEKRKEAIAAEKSSSAVRLSYSCTVCGKQYSSERAYNNHLTSKRHVSNAASAGDKSSAAVVRPARERPEVRPPQDVNLEGEESDSDWEEVSGDEAVEVGTEEGEAGGEVEEEEEEEWRAGLCLFCQKDSKDDLSANLEHMHSMHGFFVPDTEFLKDLTGLLEYLGTKIEHGHMCLFCDGRGRQFHSAEAARRHMISKSHCKLRYGDGEGLAEEELEEFYDFSSSYLDPEASQLMVVDSAEAPVALTSGGHELVLRGEAQEDGTVASRVIGSREMARYYRQRHRPSEAREGVLVNAAIAKYRALGLATQEKKWMKKADAPMKQAQRREGERTKIALKANVIRDLPKNCTF